MGILTSSAVLGLFATVEQGVPRYVAAAGALGTLLAGLGMLIKELRATHRYWTIERHRCPMTGGPCARLEQDEHES